MRAGELSDDGQLLRRLIKEHGSELIQLLEEVKTEQAKSAKPGKSS